MQDHLERTVVLKVQPRDGSVSLALRLLEMPVLRPHPTSTDSKTPGMAPEICASKSLPGDRGVFFVFCFLFFNVSFFILRESEREREHREGAERESQAGSMLSARSPTRAGPQSHDHEITT